MTPITTMQPPCALSAGTRMHMHTRHPLGSFSGRIEYEYGFPAKRLHTYLRWFDTLSRKFCSRSPIGTTGPKSSNNLKTKVWL